MKKLFLPLLCLFLIFGLSEARMSTMIVVGPAAAGCGQTQSSESHDSSCLLGYTGDYEYWHGSFTAVAGTIKTVYIWLSKVGTPTEDVTVALCTSKAGPVPDQCTNADAVIAEADVSTDFAWEKVNFTAGYTLTGSVVYHVRVFADQDDGSNYYATKRDTSVAGEDTGRSADGSSWSTSSDEQLNFILTTCEE